MVLLDTNVYIYLASGRLSSDVLPDDDLAFASITKIEALGYWRINVAEQSYLGQLFGECEQLDLDDAVIKSAIQLRQRSRMSLGDSIIAASAIEHDCELWTANVADFNDIEGLRLLSIQPTAI